MPLTEEQLRLIFSAISAVAGLAKILETLVGDAHPRVKGAIIALILISLSLALTYTWGLQPALLGVRRAAVRIASWAAVAIALLLALQLTWRLVKQLMFRTLTTPWSPPHQLLHYVASRVYGMEYARMRVTVTIEQHGGAAYRREVELVAHSAFAKIRHYFFGPFKDLRAGIDKEPKVQAAPGESRDVALERNLADGYQRVSILQFDPALSRGKRVRYICEDYPSEDTFAIRPSERVRREKVEYAVFDITVPTKHLIFEVQFPESFRPQELRPAVWYLVDQSKYAHESEYERVRKVFKGMTESEGKCVARFEIRAPAIGLTYGLRWEPPEWVKFASESPKAT